MISPTAPLSFTFTKSPSLIFLSNNSAYSSFIDRSCSEDSSLKILILYSSRSARNNFVTSLSALFSIISLIVVSIFLFASAKTSFACSFASFNKFLLLASNSSFSFLYSCKRASVLFSLSEIV